MVGDDETFLAGRGWGGFLFENICFPQEGGYIFYSLMGQETEKQKLSDLFPSHHLWLMPSGEIYDRSANNSLISRKFRQKRW